MRTLVVSILSLGIFSSALTGATSKSLYPTGGAVWAGTHGNIVFNGQEFVTATAQSDGALALSFLNSNGLVVSNWSLSMTGSSPRVSVNGAGYLLGFVQTNASPSVFTIAEISHGQVTNISTVATDVTGDGIALSTAAGKSLAVWQSNGTPAHIFARALDGVGSPVAPAFPIIATTRAQQFPSVGTDGTNFLVSFMLQRSLSNDWQTIAQLIHDGAPVGAAALVSAVNSLYPHPTTTVLGGTNYLVAWSADEVSKPAFASSNLVYPMVKGALVSLAGAELNVSYSIGRAAFTNLNPAVAYGQGRFMATWSRATWSDGAGVQVVQPVGGGPFEYPISCGLLTVDAPPAIAFGQNRFCVLYSEAQTTHSLILAAEEMTPARLLNVQREMNYGGITAESSLADWRYTEVSTNLIDWSPRMLWSLPFDSANQPQFFVRLVDYKWQCINQLRAIEWAKQRWQIDYYRTSSYDMPAASDLFGPSRYLPVAPVCPAEGTYDLGTLSTKVTCTVAAHTL